MMMVTGSAKHVLDSDGDPPMLKSDLHNKREKASTCERERLHTFSISIFFSKSSGLPIFIDEVRAVRRREAIIDLFAPHYVLENHARPSDFLGFGGCCHTIACGGRFY